MAQKRITFIDTAKFFAIYFVIISHCRISTNISHFLFAFHVPLFFILYGFVYKIRHNQRIINYLKEDMKSLVHRVLVPYFLLAFILGIPLSPKPFLFVCYGSIQSLSGITSTHLWFLPCYFAAVVLYNLICISSKTSNWLRPFIFFILALVSAFLDSTNDFTIELKGYVLHLFGNNQSTGENLYIGFPFAINVAFSGVVFIYIGTLLRRLFDNLPWLLNKQSVFIIFFVTFILGCILFNLNNGDKYLIAMSLSQYGNYSLFIVTAIVLSVSTLMLAIIFDNSLFAKYGKYTLSIYAFHLALVFVPSLLFKLLPFSIQNYPEIEAILYGSIVLFISCLLIPIIKRIDSNLIGEHK